MLSLVGVVTAVTSAITGASVSYSSSLAGEDGETKNGYENYV